MVAKVAYPPNVYIHHICHINNVIKKLKDQIPNAQNKRSGGKANQIYETYKIKSCRIGVIFTPTHMT